MGVLPPEPISFYGWGVIFSRGIEPAVREALMSLLDYRHQQAGDLYAELEVYPGERAREFLARYGGRERLPRYLLLVADPAQVPFEFQFSLEMQRGIGRLWFDAAEDYHAYADTVLHAAEGAFYRPHGALFFAPQHPHDPLTQRIAAYLVEPLSQRLVDRRGMTSQRSWVKSANLPLDQSQLLISDQAIKANLMNSLSFSPPGLIFAAGHGLGFPPGHPKQPDLQGALVCQDWPGPALAHGEIPLDAVLSAEDVSALDLGGALCVLYASYSLGTPQQDFYMSQVHSFPVEAASQAFVSRLSSSLLARARALAVIGWVDRVWGFAQHAGLGSEMPFFERMLTQLMSGVNIADATQVFFERWAELHTNLVTAVEEVNFGLQPNPQALAQTWTARNDARNLAILGDPAVRIPTITPDQMQVAVSY